MNAASTAKHTALALVPVLLAWTPAAARKTTFAPAFSLQPNYVTNIDPGADGDSDMGASIQADLPLHREWQRAEFDLRYRPSYSIYRDNGELDHDAHRASLSLVSRLGRTTTLSFSSGFSRTQVQAVPEELDDEDLEDIDLALTERTERQTMRSSLRLSHEPSASWRWSVSVGWADREHDPIPEFIDAGLTSDDIEDRTETRGGLRISRRLTRSSDFGLSVGRRRYDLSDREEDSDLFGFTFNHSISQRSDLSVTLGSFRTTGEKDDGSAVNERSGVDARVDYVRTYRRFRLRARADHSPTSGGSLRGTSSNTDVGLSIASSGRRTWNWDVSPRFSHRNSADEDVADRDIWALRGRVERELDDRLSLRLGLSLVDQSTEGESDSSVLGLNAGLVWRPRGYASVEDER